MISDRLLGRVHVAPLLASLLLAVTSFVFVGCTTAPNATLAPRSNIPREHALQMAQAAASAIGGEVFTVSATGSMKPTLDEGSIVTIERVQFNQLRQGDIVIYRNTTGTPVVHRLYERTSGRWLVLGDNNPSVDREAVNPQNLVGRVCAIFYTSAGGYASAPAAAASR